MLSFSHSPTLSLIMSLRLISIVVLPCESRKHLFGAALFKHRVPRILDEVVSVFGEIGRNRFCNAGKSSKSLSLSLVISIVVGAGGVADTSLNGRPSFGTSVAT